MKLPKRKVKPDDSPIDFDSAPVSFGAGDISFDATPISFDDLALGSDPEPPLPVDYTGNLETDTVAEAEATLSAFQQRAKAEEKRRLAATDSEFWCALCFQTREQKEEFLRKLGLIEHGDKYLDGQVVARKLGITLPAADAAPRQARIDPKFAALSRE